MSIAVLSQGEVIAIGAPGADLDSGNVYIYLQNYEEDENGDDEYELY